MTLVTESLISRSVQTAWKAVFGEVLPAATAGQLTWKGPLLVARVHILGSMPSSLLIVFPLEDARRAAAAFFRRDPASVDEALVRDVFGELANMVGGLLKRHFPHSSRLSLPEVRQEQEESPGQKTVAEAVFSAGRGPLAVRLVQNLS